MTGLLHVTLLRIWMKGETLIVRPTKNDALLMASFVTGRWPGFFAIQTHGTWRASCKGHSGHFTLSGRGIQPIGLVHGILEPFFPMAVRTGA